MSLRISNRCLQVFHWILRILGAQASEPSTTPTAPSIRSFTKIFTKKSITLDLPLEILEHIFTFLPLPSKVCLALTSKRFHQLFSSVLDAKELSFPLLAQKEAYVITEEYHQRMTLLTQLEDSRWACCGRCQKLHPREEFSRLREEYLPSLERSRPWSRTCTTWAGILDLCPCIAMTLRDRKHIVEYLNGTTERHKPILSFIRKGLFQDSLNEKGERCLEHICPACPSVQVELTLSITESGQLTSCARYEASRSVSSQPTLSSIPVCCYKTLSSLFYHWPPDSCNTCLARVLLLPLPAASLRSRAVQVTRFLGRERWFADSKSSAGSDEFGRKWSRQCRDHNSYIPT